MSNAQRLSFLSGSGTPENSIQCLSKSSQLLSEQTQASPLNLIQRLSRNISTPRQAKGRSAGNGLMVNLSAALIGTPRDEVWLALAMMTSCGVSALVVPQLDID